jgi:hypothetical protein
LLVRLKPKFVFLAVLIAFAFRTEAQTPIQPQLTPEQIVAKLAEHDRERKANLKGYTSRRTYHLEYQGFPGNKEAEMVVEARYVAPSSKEFEVISESGSKFMIRHVLRKLLTSEQEALNRDNQRETAMTTANYDFSLERQERENDHLYYVLKAEPKRKNKFLFRGLLWVDASDFAVAKIDAEPARNPSFWISKTQVQHRYEKVEEFWLPARNTSKTNVRLGGVATLTIDYGEYHVSRQIGQQNINSLKSAWK